MSGKDGALIVTPDGKASGSTVVPDPLAALDTEYVAARTVNPPNKWSSIVFHNGSPRVLCGKIFAGALPPQCGVEFILVNADTDQQLGPLKAEVCLSTFRYSIEARPTAGCPATSSARMVLSKGATIVQDRNEGTGPFTLFGDSAGDYNGRPMVEGQFTVKAQLFAERRQQGLVVERSFDFSVVDCSRRL